MNGNENSINFFSTIPLLTASKNEFIKSKGHVDITYRLGFDRMIYDFFFKEPNREEIHNYSNYF